MRPASIEKEDLCAAPQRIAVCHARFVKFYVEMGQLAIYMARHSSKLVVLRLLK